MTNGLTPRESEIVRLIWTHGFTSRQCAKQLRINPRTVESHMANIHRKIGVRNKAELLRWWVENKR